MSSIIDPSSIYSSYAQTTKSFAGASLQDKLGNVNASSDEDELMGACKQFEAYFVQKIIEQAKSTISEEEDEGEYMQYFGDIMTEQYANIITESGSTGLAQQLYDSMKSTYNITEALRPGNPKLGKEELHNLFKKLDKDYNIVINGIKELD